MLEGCKFDALNYNIIQSDDGSLFVVLYCCVALYIEINVSISFALALSLSLPLALFYALSLAFSWFLMSLMLLLYLSYYSKLLYIRFIFFIIAPLLFCSALTLVLFQWWWWYCSCFCHSNIFIIHVLCMVYEYMFNACSTVFI